MSFKDIHLPGFVLAEMYKNNVVETKTKTPVKAGPISFLGDNKKNITILLEDRDAVFINDERLNFLSNILQACHLTLADVAIVNTLQQPGIGYQNIVGQLSPRFVLLFDVNAGDMGFPIDLQLYQLQKINDCMVMAAAPLDTMLAATQDAKIEKSRLWVNLKTMFNL
jgi:hypothetical protein